MKKESLIIKVCDFIAKYSIYALIFLAPIFFLPWTSDVLDFNKQALLLLLVFVSLFATVLKILVSGKFKINQSPMNMVVGVLFLAYLFSNIFSLYRYGSFWGISQQISESLLTIICFVLFYFLVNNNFSKEDVSKSIFVLSFSAIIAELFGVLQIFGLFILPFGFLKTATFNTIGSAGSLGLFSAIMLPLAIVLLIISKKYWKILFLAGIIISGLVFVLVNYQIIWWVVILGAALLLILGTIKRNLFDGRWMAFPIFFLVISLFFILLNPQASWLPQGPNEIPLPQQSGLDIAIKTLKVNPVFGSGSGTFSYDFLKFKSPDFSKTPIWNITFSKSSSKVLNDLATTGLLGFLTILALMILPIFYGIKYFIFKSEAAEIPTSEKSTNQNYYILLLGLIVALSEQILSYFVYDSNIVMDFVSFFIITVIICLIAENKKIKSYVLKSSSMLTLGVTFVFTIFFIFGVGLLILDGQRYFAEVNYYKGLANYQSGNKADGLKNLQLAASLNNQSDLYFRQLSQAFLLSLNDELQNTKSAPSDQEKTKIQDLIKNSIKAGQIAVGLNPNDANNWSSLGYVYQSLIGVSTDAKTSAINSYDSALKLDPNNPYLFFQEGNTYLAVALNSSSDQEDLSKAQTQLEKAVSLNPNYSDAMYALGLVYDASGQLSKSIAEFQKLQQLNPTNKNIQQILDNLNAGKPILQSATPPVTAPTDNSSSIKSTTTKTVTKTVTKPK